MEAEQLIAISTKLFGKEEAEVREALYEKDSEGNEKLKENFTEFIYSWDADRIKRYKDDTTKKYDDGYKKATAESLSKAEKEYRDKYGITEDKKGIELIDAIVAKHAGTGGKRVTDDDIKRHPLYLELENSVKDKYVPKSEYEKVTGEFDSFKTGIEKDRMRQNIKARAETIFNSEEFVLSADPGRRLTQLRDFYNDLNSRFDHAELSDSGEILALVKDGKRLEDAHGNPIKFSQLVNSVADSRFDRKQQDPKGGGGNKNNPGNQKPNENVYKGAIPKSMAEVRQMQIGKTQEEAMQIMQAYIDSQKPKA